MKLSDITMIKSNIRYLINCEIIYKRVDSDIKILQKAILDIEVEKDGNEDFVKKVIKKAFFLEKDKSTIKILDIKITSFYNKML